METHSQKVRTRTAEELADREKGFLELTHLLDENGFPYFLCLGGLLGAVREKRFIPWDWDVEICVYATDVFERKDELLKLIAEAGFEILKKDLSFENFKIDTAKYQAADVTSFTIIGWHKEGDIWRRNALRIPARFLDTLDEIDFLGRRFKCPHEPEQYLEFQYGKDWRTPKRTADKDDYWTREAFPGGDVTEGGRLGVLVRRFKKKLRSWLR